MLNAFGQSLDTLQHLAKVFDGGFTPIVFAMATEVYKILTENGVATRLRGTRRFPTPDNEERPRNLMAFHKLTIARTSSPPPDLRFFPKFFAPDRPSKLVEFKVWWHREVIYRASAAPPGTPAGMIPVNDSPVVPFDAREKVTRLGLVNLLRNKLGAHQTSEMPKLLDDLEDAKTWASFGFQTPEGFISTDDGSLKVSVSPLAAMMRQITHELLVAYDRIDEPPADENLPKPC